MLTGRTTRGGTPSTAPSPRAARPWWPPSSRCPPAPSPHPQSPSCMVNARDQQQRSALHLAAVAGRAQVVAILLARGARADMVDEAGATPVHLAVTSGSAATLKVFVEGGFGDTVDQEGRTPTMWAGGPPPPTLSRHGQGGPAGRAPGGQCGPCGQAGGQKDRKACLGSPGPGGPPHGRVGRPRRQREHAPRHGRRRRSADRVGE